MHWYLLALERCFDFRGRSRRKEFFVFIGLSLALLIFAMVLFGSANPSALEAANNHKVGSDSQEFETFTRWILMPLTLLMAYVQLPLSIRRLHDLGLAGWHYLWLFLPYIGPGIFLIMMLQDGEPHTNRYGPDSKGRGLDGDPDYRAPVPAAATRVRSS